MFQYFLARLSYSTYQCKCSFNEYRFHAINKALRIYGCDTWSCPSPSPPSWPGWAWQCSWRSPSFSQRQNLCCLTFWCDFLKVYSRLEGYFISVCQYFSLYFVTDARTHNRTYRSAIAAKKETYKNLSKLFCTCPAHLHFNLQVLSNCLNIFWGFALKMLKIPLNGKIPFAFWYTWKQ